MSEQPPPTQPPRRAGFYVYEDYSGSGSSAGSSPDHGALPPSAPVAGTHPRSQLAPPHPYALGQPQQYTGVHGIQRGGAFGAQRGGHGAQRGGAPAHLAAPPVAGQHFQQQQASHAGRGQPSARGVNPVHARGAPRPVFVPGRGFLPPGGHAPHIGDYGSPQQQVSGMAATAAQSSSPGSGSPGSYPDIVNPGHALSGKTNFSGLSDRSSSGGSANWGEVRPAPGGATRRCTICNMVYYIADEAQHMRSAHDIPV